MLKSTAVLTVILMPLLCGTLAAAEATDLRCEYLKDPLGIHETKPRLSWIVASDRRGERQTAYQVLVASSPDRAATQNADLWDSGKVESNQTANVDYAGRPLVSRQGCWWELRVWDADGKPGRWSQPAHWEMGLLSPEEWSAKWITATTPPSTASEGPLTIRHAIYEAVEGGGPMDVTTILAGRVKDNRLSITVNNQTFGSDPAVNKVKRLRLDYEVNGAVSEKEISEGQTLTLPEDSSPLQYLRKSFSLQAPIVKARLYASALGLYELHLNGRRVGDHVLAPDWTDYRRRVRYQAYDITALLKSGENVIAGWVANGWYSGHIGNGGNQFFGKEPALLVQLEITFADGRIQRVVTDGTWKLHPSPILATDFMLGESYDARKELGGWDEPGLDDRAWPVAGLRDEPAPLLEGQVMQPVRQIMELAPKVLTEPKPGRWTFDLGQNMVGVVRLRITAPAGTKITLRHAEMLNPDGTVYTVNLRSAVSTDTYICKGSAPELWQPHFTFHGFRYVEITGLPGKPTLDIVRGIVISSDTPQAGQFSGNYISIPTDCPQRDERLGWMGDAQVFVRTATYNADVAAFFSKWLVDVDDGQSPEGSFSDVNPNTMGCGSVPAWADAGVICPWTIYQVYGDTRILERHLPAMTRWVEWCRAHSTNLIRDKERGNDYGDWLSIGANTPKDLIGTAYFAYSTHLVARSYEAVGKAAEAAKYEQLFNEIKAAFIKRFVTPDGRVHGNTQCAYVMALRFDLLPPELRARAAQYLQDDIKAKDWHVSTGFVGVSYLLPVLTEAGMADTAYRLLRQDTFPSWLFSVKHGATTIWERWDGWTPDKGFQDPGMNSFNHYSLGSCGEYLFGTIGGIRPDGPGFSTIRIEPVIRQGLTWAKARYDSLRGRIETSWKTEGRQVVLDVTIPANTTATIFIPAKHSASVTESGKPLDKSPDVRFLRQDPQAAVCQIGSGHYTFTAMID